MLQALIFDCDGVLVDTERDGHRVAFNEPFARPGSRPTGASNAMANCSPPRAARSACAGISMRRAGPPAWPDKDALIAKLHKLKTDIFMQLIEEGSLPLRPGIQRLVDEAIASGVTLAVCSTSNERAVQAVVDVLLGAERSARSPSSPAMWWQQEARAGHLQSGGRHAWASRPPIAW